MVNDFVPSPDMFFAFKSQTVDPRNKYVHMLSSVNEYPAVPCWIIENEAKSLFSESNALVSIVEQGKHELKLPMMVIVEHFEKAMRALR